MPSTGEPVGAALRFGMRPARRTKTFKRIKESMIANGSKKLLMAACLSAGVAFAPYALAQDANQPSEPAVEAPAVTDEKLQSFAVAFLEVENLKQQYTQQLQEAGDDAERQQQLQNEAGEKILQAVEETDGISVDEYNQIIQSAQADPDLAQRLTDAIGQASQ